MAIKTASGSGLSNSLSSGLVLLNTTTFSGVSSTSLAASTFTSAYTNYQLIVNLTNFSVTGDLRIRLRASGTDNSSAVYGNSNFYAQAPGGTNGLATNDNTNSLWLVGYMDSTSLATRLVLDIFDPCTTIQTSAFSRFVRNQSTTNGSLEWRNGGHVHGGTTSFDSLTISPASGNMTGSYSIFGYNK